MEKDNTKLILDKLDSFREELKNEMKTFENNIRKDMDTNLDILSLKADIALIKKKK